MSARRNGSAIASLVLRMGEAREPAGRPASPAGLRSSCGPVLAIVAWSGASPLEVVPLAMVARGEQPALIELERARLEREHPGALVEVVQ